MKKQTKRVSTSDMLCWLAWAGCIVLEIQHALKLGEQEKLAVGLLILVAVCLLAVKNPVAAISLAPVICLVAPIASVRFDTAGQVNLADAYVGAVFGGFGFSRRAHHSISLGWQPALVTIVMALVFVGWILSGDFLGATLTMIGIVEIVLVYLLTINIVRTFEDAVKVVWSMIAGVSAASVLVIYSFAVGQPLLLDLPPEVVDNYSELVRTRPEVFAVATFFVTGFIFPLSAAIIVTTIFLLRSAQIETPRRLLAVASLATNFVALILFNNKTSIFGCIVILLWTTLVGRIRGKSTIFVSIPAVLLSVGAIYWISGISDNVVEGLIQRNTNRFSNNETLELRMDMWKNALGVVMTSPRIAAIGLGPDFTVRNQRDEVVQQIQQSTYGSEGALDSGYIYVLVNYGAPVLLIVCSIFFSIVRALARSERRRFGDDRVLAFGLRASIMLWLVMSITQQHAVSKPVFILAVMSGLAFVLVRRVSRDAWRVCETADMAGSITG